MLLLASSFYAQQRGIGLKSSPSGQRVALIIGNSDYEFAPLKNPINDAQDMAQALRELGFDIIYKENLDQNDMKRVIREFGAKIRKGGVGLFYYAGHGLQVKGENYLIPINMKVESEEEVEYEAVDTGLVLAQMESAGNSMNIVILDACRNNPFVRSFRSASRGLAQMNAPSGTLIAYATAPGSVASDGNVRNGLYTQELLKNIKTPGLGIEDVFKRVRIAVRNLTQGKQTPWESSSLIGDFYFNNNSATPAFDLKSPGISTSQSAVVTNQSANATALNLEGTKWDVTTYNGDVARVGFEAEFLSNGVLKIDSRMPDGAGKARWTWRQEGTRVFLYPRKRSVGIYYEGAIIGSRIEGNGVDPSLGAQWTWTAIRMVPK